MVHIGNYLRAHNRLRLAILAVTFLVASIALFLGVGVYALTTGPKAVGDYMQGRLAAAGWIENTVPGTLKGKGQMGNRELAVGGGRARGS